MSSLRAYSRYRLLQAYPNGSILVERRGYPWATRRFWGCVAAGVKRVLDRDASQSRLSLS